jgi:hypothetical protein
MREKSAKSRSARRPPRIRVPNQERAIFQIEDQKIVGIVQRLSLTGGSALLVKGAISEGTVGQMMLNTVSGKVIARVQFLKTGADGVPYAQAFRFLEMDVVSGRRFENAIKQMQANGFSDVRETSLDLALKGLGKLLNRIVGQRKSKS